MNRVIFFEFAGRRANMDLQRQHITALLDTNPGSEFHLWDLTRDPKDQEYIREWAGADDRIALMDHLHPGHPFRCLYPKGTRRPRGWRRCVCLIHRPPYEEPYRWYCDNADSYDAETTFVKFDDDVIWMDTERFSDVLKFLETNPLAIASANVTNNAVCAKYDPGMRQHIMRHFGPETDQDWWWLHTSADFALESHQHTLRSLEEGVQVEGDPVRTRPGEKISINFVAMRQPVMCQIAQMMKTDRLGDEGTVDSRLPWIIPTFRAAHLTFGPQDRDIEPLVLDSIRRRYIEIGEK